jgi:hypothetical protein
MIFLASGTAGRKTDRVAGEKEDLSEFKQTEYWQAVQNFQKFIVADARNNGLSTKRPGEAVHAALSTAKPKARYEVVPQRFKNSAQTSSCEDVPRPTRKAARTHKAVASLEPRVLTAHDKRTQWRKQCFVSSGSLPISRHCRY